MTPGGPAGARAALLQRILGDRRDDSLRLAYADALGNDPRAELIRVQLALSGLILRVGKEYASRTRERALLRAHQREWAAPFAPFVERCFFRRGFVEQVVLEAGALLEHGPAMLAAEPILDVIVRRGTGLVARLAASPWLQGMRSLSLVAQGLDDDDARALAQSPYLDDLRWLDLGANKIGEAGFEALAASTRLPQLRWLGLRFNAAPDPTPQPMLEGELLHGEALTPFGERLRETYPGRRWMEPCGAILPDPWLF